MILNAIVSKKRAVSPVIAAILLIGLTVMAGGVIAFIILPMLNSGFDINNMDAKKSGDIAATNETITVKVIINNKNTEDAEITKVMLSYTNDSVSLTIDLTVFTKKIVKAGSGDLYEFIFSASGTDVFANDVTATKITIYFAEGNIEADLT